MAALSSDFLTGNLLDRLAAVERRLDALERARTGGAAVIPTGGPDSTVWLSSAELQAAAANSSAAFRLFLRDSVTGQWWTLSVRDVKGVERLFIQRVREAEVR